MHITFGSLAYGTLLVLLYAPFSIFLMLHADPRESEIFRPLDMHHGMEVRLGLSKGPVYPSLI